MPNRILRPWIDSESVNSLSDSAEVFFVRLIQSADDFGRFYGSPMLLKSYLYPLKEKRTSDIANWIKECVKAGLILHYEVSGKQYLEIRKFNQRMRLKRKSKFPDPKNDSHMTVICQSRDGHMAVTCQSDDSQMTVPRRETRDERRETETRIAVSDDKSSFTACPEPEKSSGDPGCRKRMKIFFDYAGDSKIHGIDQKQLALWKENFPAIDVEEELRKMSAWLDANRQNRKTNVKRFIVNWLTKTQDRAPRVQGQENEPAGAGDEEFRI